MEPSVFGDHLRSDLRLFIIAHHDIVSFATDLTVFGQPYFNIFDHGTDGTETAVLFIISVHTDYRRSFGKSIPFHDHDLSCCEHAQEPHLAGRCTGYNRLNVSTKTIAPFGENEFIGQCQLGIVPPALIFINFKTIAQVNGPKE